MIEVEDVSVSYRVDGQSIVALHGASLSVAPGEIVALVGPNGSGKSTLGRLLCAMQLPDSGRVLIDGLDASKGAPERQQVRARVGMVRQNPVDQIVSTLVSDEVAFGPRNLSLSAAEVDERVRDALARVGLEGMEERDTTALSGGEQQRLAFAGVLAMRPGYIVLDEPTSQLDATLRPRMRSLVTGLAHQDGIGVAIITHDPLEVLCADRVLVLDHGGVPKGDGAVLAHEPWGLLCDDSALWDHVLLPSPFTEALRAVVRHGYEPSSMVNPAAIARWMSGLLKRSSAEGRELLDEVAAILTFDAQADGLDGNGAAAEGLQAVGSGLMLSDVSFSYGNDPVLQDIDIEVPAGSVTLLAGSSGSGKSTLACLASGLYEPDTGTVLLDGASVRPGDVGLAFQNPESQFFLDTVYDEIAFGPRNLGADERDVDERVRDAAAACGLDEALLIRYPFDLSGGQARRVAIASVLSLRARALILDEPTAGLDAASRVAMHRLVRAQARAGIAVLVISHDLEEWLPVCSSVALLSQGRITWQGSARALWNDARPLQACGMSLPPALELRAAVEALRGHDTDAVTRAQAGASGVPHAADEDAAAAGAASIGGVRYEEGRR